MEKNEIIQKMYRAIIALDMEEAKKIAAESVKNNQDLTKLVQEAMSPAMAAIGDRFQKGEMYLPELQKSADVFQAAMSIIEPKLLETQSDYQEKKRIIIGTVKGDLHSIGKDLVATMLKTNGYEVIDLGVNIASLEFMEKAVDSNADVIALSALLTTTMAAQKEVIEALEAYGVRDRFKVIVGGAPIDQKWADDIGADAYGKNAVEAVKTMGGFFSE